MGKKRLWCPFDEVEKLPNLVQDLPSTLLSGADDMCVQLSAADTQDSAPSHRRPSPEPPAVIIRKPFEMSSRPQPSDSRSEAGERGPTVAKVDDDPSLLGASTPSESWSKLANLRLSLECLRRPPCACGAVPVPATGPSAVGLASGGSSRSSSTRGSAASEYVRFAGTTPFAQLLAF